MKNYTKKQLVTENSTIEIGKHEDWLEYSDHMPITITLHP